MVRNQRAPQHIENWWRLKDSQSPRDGPGLLCARTDVLKDPEVGVWEPRIRPCPCGCPYDFVLRVDVRERAAGGRRRSLREVHRTELVQMAAWLDEVHPDLRQQERADLLGVDPSTYSRLRSHPDRVGGGQPAIVLWTDERYKMAMRAWRERHGRWPTRADWSPAKAVARGDSTAGERKARFESGWFEMIGYQRRWRTYPHAGSFEFRRLLNEAIAEDAGSR